MQGYDFWSLTGFTRWHCWVKTRVWGKIMHANEFLHLMHIIRWPTNMYWTIPKASFSVNITRSKLLPYSNSAMKAFQRFSHTFAHHSLIQPLDGTIVIEVGHGQHPAIGLHHHPEDLVTRMHVLGSKPIQFNQKLFQLTHHFAPKPLLFGSVFWSPQLFAWIVWFFFCDLMNFMARSGESKWAKAIGGVVSMISTSLYPVMPDIISSINDSTSTIVFSMKPPMTTTDLSTSSRSIGGTCHDFLSPHLLPAQNFYGRPMYFHVHQLLANELNWVEPQAPFRHKRLTKQRAIYVCRARLLSALEKVHFFPGQSPRTRGTRMEKVQGPSA